MTKQRKKSLRTEIEETIDRHVGKRMRQRRTLLKKSQSDLADVLGITFQQVQKYENGLNRIGSSRLWRLSQELGVPVAYFFEGLLLDDEAASQQPDYISTQLDDRESLKLLRNFFAIPKMEIRNALSRLINSLSKV